MRRNASIGVSSTISKEPVEGRSDGSLFRRSRQHVFGGARAVIGRKLGHYRLLESIGRGGMGVVYRARDEQLHRDVAVKVLHEGAVSDAAARSRLRQEAILLSKVNHPNVAVIHYFGTEDGIDFLAMEYVEGRTLDAMLAGRPLPEGEVRRLGIQLLQGLKAAHAHGVVHRDLKPGNLRVTPDGLLKILDFGLARRWEPQPDLLSTLGLNELTTAGLSDRFPGIEGTVPYMPPEQLQGGEIDARSDIYAAGMVLYEMAVGSRAFAEARGPQLVAAILNQRPPPPHGVNPQISSGLSATILKSLEKDPESRHASAAELLEDLQRPAAALPPASPEATAGRPRRRASLVAWAAGAVLLGALVWFASQLRERSHSSVQPGEIRAVAVLPLEDLSGDPNNQYFADGMTDELITRLSQIGSVQVIARRSIMTYRNRDVPLAQIAEELGVDAIVEGSVLREVDRVRVSARLLAARSGRNLWADSYERDARNVLSLQGELARAITDQIRAVVTPEEQVRLASSRPIDPQAFELYLQGRFLTDRENFDELNKAIERFRGAIEIEPEFALAYAGMAQVYYQLSTVFLPPDEAMPKARAAVERALELDPNLSEAHVILAAVQSFSDWNWTAGETSFRQAIRLEPGNASAHMFYSYYLTIRGRFDEAIQEIAIARRLDPLSLYTSVASLYPLYEGRRFDEAIAAARKLLESEPDHWHLSLILGQALIGREEYSEAITVLQRASDLEQGQNRYCLAWLGVARAGAGERAAASRILQQLRELEVRGEPHYLEAIIYVSLGEFDRALDLLEKCVEQRSEEVLMIGNDPALDPLRSKPRFARLQQQMGF